MINLFKNLSISLGQVFRRRIIDNFQTIENFINNLTDVLNKHKTTDKNAHNSKQISHQKWTVNDELQYQWEIKDNLVIGANGDGIQETKESRTAVTDKVSYSTLNNRLKQDFLYLLKNDDDIKAQFEKYKNETNKTLSLIEQPLDRLNYQKGIGKVSTRGKDGVTFIQGININKDKDEIYITRKDNAKSEMIIERRKYSTLDYIDQKLIKVNSTGAFNEGSPFFYNEQGDLCFVIRTNYDQMACIFNYTQDRKSKDFVLPGSSKHGSDLDGRYYFTHFGHSRDIFGVYIYDMDSVKAMKPKLIKMLRFDKEAMFDEKPQGITMVNDHFVITRGETEPIITVLNFSGKIIQNFPLDKYSVQDMLVKTMGSKELEFSPLKYETEASCAIKGDDGNEYLVIPHVVYNNEMVYLALAGDKTGYKVITKEPVQSKIYPQWNQVTDYKNGTSAYSQYDWEKPQYMMDSDGFITLRGIATYPRRDRNEEWTAMNKVLFTIPYPYINYTNQNFKTVAGGNPEKANRIMVTRNSSGLTDVVLVSTSDNSDKPFCVLDGIRFYSETRLEKTELN